MALQFEIASLEGLDDGVKSLYVQHGEVFRLDVSGIDPADELKEALRKERELNAENRKAAKEAEQLAKDAEIEAARQKGEHEEAARLLQEKINAITAEVEEERERTKQERQNSINERLDNQALTLATQNASNTENAELLKVFIRQQLVYNDEGEIVGQDGKQIADIVKSMEDSGKYASLWKGNGSTGSGAVGGDSSGATENVSTADLMYS